MKNLKIVSINTTHSQEDSALRCRTDKEWVDTINICREHAYPMYVRPHDSPYLLAQTLDADGYIISGDYETVTPELGRVKYSIWNEKSDYYKSLFPPTKLKPTFWERNDEWIKACFLCGLTVTICCIANNVLKYFGIEYNVYPFAVGYLFATIAVKDEQIKRLKDKL